MVRATYRARTAPSRLLTSCSLRATVRDVSTKRNTENPADTTRWLTFRVERAHVDRLREVAAADHRNVSQELRRLIEMRIAQADEPQDLAA